MSRAQYRGGKAPIRTAAELALLLPIPLLMIIEGYAQPAFPAGTPAHPSPFVAIIQARVKGTIPTSSVAHLPVFVHEEQWTNVVVPLLQAKTLQEWRGLIWSLGGLVSLLNNIVGPTGEVVFQAGEVIGTSGWSEERVGRLFACDYDDRSRVSGKLSQYLTLLSGSIYREALAAGY